MAESRIRFVVYDNTIKLQNYEWVYKRAFKSISEANDYIFKEKKKNKDIKFKVEKETIELCYIV